MPFVQVNDVKLHYEMEGIGSADTFTGNLAVGRYLAEHIRGAEFKTVDGSAHMLSWEKPAETCAALLEFLRRH